jgi:hypothetical protein
MPNDKSESRAENLQVLLPWGSQSAETREGEAIDAALWVTGGVSLLLWTGIALLLTSA